MLDVHPPEHAIGGVRDFAIHLLTITVGLLIALGLEQIAEAVHHRHQREAADAAIRQEIRENIATVEQGQTTLAQESANLVYILGYADARINGRTADASKIQVGLTEGPLEDAAWRTATATGVVGYMDYGTAEKYARCYKEVGQYELMEQKMLEGYLAMDSFAAVKKPEQLSVAELQEALPVVRGTLADLGGTRDVGHGLTGICNEALE